MSADDDRTAQSPRQPSRVGTISRIERDQAAKEELVRKFDGRLEILLLLAGVIENVRTMTQP